MVLASGAHDYNLLSSPSLGSLPPVYCMRAQAMHLTTADFLGWCEQLASVLAYLHGCSPPIVHRDVKLDNVRRVNDGDLLVYECA